MSIFEYDEERERELIKKAEFECGKEEGMKTGIELGKAQGMRALIETCRDLGASREVALFSLKKQFSLSEEEAERQLDKFWPVTME